MVLLVKVFFSKFQLSIFPFLKVFLLSGLNIFSHSNQWSDRERLATDVSNEIRSMDIA